MPSEKEALMNKISRIRRSNEAVSKAAEELKRQRDKKEWEEKQEKK